MKKKILTILLVGMFLLTGITSATALSVPKNTLKNEIYDENPEYVKSCLDQLDQSQTEYDEWINLIYDSYKAQSFKPTLGKLTRVELLMSNKVWHNGYIHLWICEDLEPWTPILYEMFWVGSSPPTYPDKGWIEFDFEDIDVWIDQTYYIAIEGTGTFDHYYVWWCSTNNPYPHGSYWFNLRPPIDEDWYEAPTIDMCFKTYGEQINQPPNTPSTPSGPSSREVGESGTYSTSATDPEGDDVYYWFDWGDNTNSGWRGPYNSGDTGSASHIWNSPGTYYVEVKAKDIHDAESISSNPLPVHITPGSVSVKITKPEPRRIYVENVEIMFFPITIIVGWINIEVYTEGANRVEFYIDDDKQPRYTDDKEPYEWLWDEFSFGGHILKVVASNNMGISDADEMEVWKFF